MSRYYATAVLRKSKNRFKVGTVAWLKEPFESWAATAEMGQPERADELAPHYTLPTARRARQLGKIHRLAAPLIAGPK